MKKLQSSVAVFGLLALSLSGVPELLNPLSDVGAAFAQGKGNGGGNGGGNGNAGENGNAGGNGQGKADGQGKSATAGSNGNGALASELAGMNAIHANPKALENADPNSQVGRIAAYRDAAVVTQGATATMAQADVNLQAANDLMATAEAMPATTDEEIAARDQAIADAQAAIDAANVALNDATAALATAAETEDAALTEATGGRELSTEALAAVRAELGL